MPLTKEQIQIIEKAINFRKYLIMEQHRTDVNDYGRIGLGTKPFI